MKNNSTIHILLGILIGIFIVIITYFVLPFPNEIKRGFFPLIAIFALGFFVLGIMLIIFTYKKKIKGRLKLFLLLTGISSAGILPSAVLHNMVYGLFIYWFGADFWEKTGLGDEPFFFILALIILPIVFLISSVGSCILLHKKSQ